MTVPENPFIFNSRRPTVYGTKGMVASSQPFATQVGIEILKKGGNAADAAVAVAAVLSVNELPCTGVGGDGCCLFYDAKKRKVIGLNGSGRTPAALTVDLLRQQGEFDGHACVSPYSAHSITVPGAVATWTDTIEHFGSGNLDMATILQPAIELAENGFPLSYVPEQGWKRAEKMLKENNSAENNLLIDGIRAPVEGEIVHLPDLAETLRAIADKGKDGFYKGRVADAIIEAVKSRGGVLTHEDLASHTSEIIEPISLDYHDWTIWELPPSSQGITALIALGIIRALEEEHGLDLSKLEHNSAEYLHIIIEVLRLAFADTRYYVADPQVFPVPTDKLLSKAYLSERAKLVNLEKRNGEIVKGYPDKTCDTVYLSVVDEEGNACSFINSNFGYFGSCIVPDKCGFPLHNRGYSFTLIEDHPNCIGPRKRPYLTLIPAIITRKSSSGDHEFEASLGVVGAFMQPQGHVQVIMNLMRYLASPQHAIDLPRICVAPAKSDGYVMPSLRRFTDVIDSVVYVEDGIAPEVVKKLEAMGHTCYPSKGTARLTFGRGQIVVAKTDARTGKRVLAAGSDPRADGQATGWL
ncbi:nucleophile aminohydrolase [Zychaea mexicana]|uniref:nucleophile aminohydrolase n=1 Tax=Zychaea mexicana TaxID=64656 RepID=UPI0022FF438E|nr:nucleophile aminohydrolase [Zychaea mexicana]KAI9496531.1 nucleophile aminohydrolase [Zychaea mexicana]